MFFSKNRQQKALERAKQRKRIKAQQAANIAQTAKLYDWSQVNTDVNHKG